MTPPNPNLPGFAENHRRSVVDVSEVRDLAKSVRGYLLQHGCASTTVAECELALVEACNNALQYAPVAGGNRKVEVEACCSDEQVELRIVDHTAGFDWPSQATLPGPESERGRGIFLIQAAMDSTRYVPGPKGNTLVLRKKRRLKRPSA
ncbi:MAG TPA: ATP-binding protein [Verrucomicrobiae bacterium]|nr:ATP-binding protein [Verrucomicrobiae bacterium]